MTILRSSKVAALVLISYFVAADALAQSKVILIQFNHQEVSTPVSMRVERTDKDVQKGDDLASGTEILIPAKTVLTMRSINDNTVTIWARAGEPGTSTSSILSG